MLDQFAKCGKHSSPTAFCSLLDGGNCWGEGGAAQLKLPEHLDAHAALGLQTKRSTLHGAAVADIADSLNHAVRKKASNVNSLTLVAGTGEALAKLTRGVPQLAVHT